MLMFGAKTKLEAIVADVLDLEAYAITPDLSPQNADTWDSLNHLRLITAVEEEFGISLTMAEIESADNIGRLLDLVELYSAPV